MPALGHFRNLYAETGGRVPTLFLVCNGPSLAAMDLSALSTPGVVTMGVNNGGHLIRPDLWTAVDVPARFMGSIWEDPRILKFIAADRAALHIWDHDRDDYSPRLAGDCPGVVTFQAGNRIREAMWLDEPRVTYGEKGGRFCVMLAALKIAWVLGFRRVFLLGVDWNYSAEKPYFFPEDREEKHAVQNNGLFRAVDGYLRRLRPHFDRAGFHVYNCNPDSGLKVFDFRAFDRAIDGVKIDVNRDTRGMYLPR